MVNPLVFLLFQFRAELRISCFVLLLFFRFDLCKMSVDRANGWPAHTAVSPSSFLHQGEERQRLTDRNSILMMQINVYIMNPVVMGFQM